jgi:hypothetical protein
MSKVEAYERLGHDTSQISLVYRTNTDGDRFHVQERLYRKTWLALIFAKYGQVRK